MKRKMFDILYDDRNKCYCLLNEHGEVLQKFYTPRSVHKDKVLMQMCRKLSNCLYKVGELRDDDTWESYMKRLKRVQARQIYNQAIREIERRKGEQ